MVGLAQVTACSFAVVPSQSRNEGGADGAPLDCESRSAAPLIDTILAVGFAAATFAAVSAEPEDQEDGAAPDWSAVSTLGVGTATTAAFVASAVHGHNSIQSCLALKRGRTPSDAAETKVARAEGSRGVMAAGSKLVGPAAVAR
jgi:hypothetical protein